MAEKKNRIERENIQDIFALTPIQEGMLFHYLKEPEKDLYFEQLALHLVGSIDMDDFKKTWQRLIQQHETLRTVFRWEEVKNPMQIVLKQSTLSLEIIDFIDAHKNTSDDSKTDEENQWIETVMKQDREQKFDLNKPPFRITLCKLTQNHHVMIINHHHILYDGWSTGIILKGFLTLYRSAAKGIEPDLTVTPRKDKQGSNFKDYVKWLQQQDKEEQKAFWSGYLKDFDSRTTLPGIATPGSCESCSSNETAMTDYFVLMSTAMKERLEQFSRLHKVTLAEMLYCAWGLVMQRYGNNRDVVFGTTISGRNIKLSNIEDIVGLFINTIPLRLQTSPGETTLQLMLKLQQSLQMREKNETAPLVDIKQYCGFDTQEELFNCLMVVDNYPLDSLLSQKDDGVYIDRYTNFEMSNYDLTLGISIFEEIKILFNYNQSQFQPHSIERLAGHFMMILESMISAPDERVSKLEMLTPEEKQEILYRINPKTHKGRTAYPSDKTIHQLVEEQVARTPEAEAIVFGDMRLTYAFVNAKANQLAHLLRQKGVGIESVIGVIGEYSVEVPIAMLAVLKAGGSYSPMIPTYPDSRVEYILKDSHSSLLLSQIDFRQHYEAVEFDGEILDIRFMISQENNAPNAFEAKTSLVPDNPIYQGNEENPESLPGTHATNLAFVLYTSGSTGKPKGVMVRHNNVNNLLSWMIKMYQLTPGTRVLQLTDYTFDPHVEDIFGTWQCGGTLFVVTHEQLIDIEPLRRYIQEEELHVVNCVPAYLNDLLAGKEKLESLRVVISGGDRLDDPLKDRLIDDGYPLTNHYGLIETTVDVLIARCTKDIPASLGWPMDNNGAYILDQDLNLMPIGITGEIGITGDNVVRGYLNKPELTHERFVPNPFFPGENLYIMRTGDLGRSDDKGNILIMDRMDNQVKIRGYRIELGEIENRLIKHHKIEEAAVVVREAQGGSDSGEERGSKYLCGYVALSGNRIIMKDSETGQERVCRIYTVAQDPSLEERIEKLHADAWPSFFTGDAVNVKYWRRVYREHPDLQFGIMDDEGNLLAAGNLAPLYWDGLPDHIPSGWDESMVLSFNPVDKERTPNTVCAVGAAVNSAYKSQGISYHILKTMNALAKEKGYTYSIFPVRLTWKEKYPDIPLEEYCRKTREDGLPFDPWLRVHTRLGGNVLGTAHRSQIIEGSIKDWEIWTGQTFPQSGEYKVKGAMQPVKIDLEKDRGVYYDQAIWVTHEPAQTGEGEYALNAMNTGDICQYLSQTLPEYMIPIKFIFLDKLPLTAIGKIDRKALPETGTIEQLRFEPPANKLEQQILDIWAEILEMDKERIGVTDNFFQLGGHSLKATKAVFQIRKALKVELDLKDFIKEPVIRLLANKIRALDDTGYLSVEACEEREYYDMSYAQRRLWIIGQFEEDSTSYNMVGTFTIRGRFNPGAFSRAIEELVRRHDSFRTVFLRINGETKQRVLRDFSGGLEQVDLQHVPDSEKEAAVRQIVQKDANRAFDLEKGPLFLFKVMIMAPEEFVLLVNIHHIVNDGWSLGVINNEIKTLYNAYLNQQESPLPPVELQYKDYTYWHNRFIEGGYIDKFQTYWLEKFKDKPTGIELPLDHPRPPIQTFKGGRVYFTVEPEYTDRLKEIYKEEDATIFMKLLTLLTIFMYRYTGQTDIMIGAPISGRGKPELYNIIGFLVNTLVYRNQIEPAETFQQLLKRVKQETMDCYQNQDYPFDLLVEKLQLDRDLSHSPLFNVMIAFDNTDIDDMDLQMEGFDFIRNTRMDEFTPSVFDLVFIMDAWDGQVNAEIMYNVDLFDRMTIERMAENFKTLVYNVLESRDIPVSHLNFIHSSEYQAITETFNATQQEFPQLLLQEMVEMQVEKNPEKTAVIFEEQSLTYEELNREANQLAHYLRQEYHIQSGQIIGICMEPSLKMIVTILGIVKSGAGYLAVDPNFPADRALHMLEDSRSPLVMINRSRPALFEHYKGQLIQVTDPQQWQQIAQYPGTNPDLISQPGDIIYVIYTSGSTGTPNGAMLSQDLLCNLIQWQHQCTDIDSSKRCLQFTTISFCVSFQEIFSTLTAGGELHLIDDIQRRDVQYLMNFLADHQIQNLYLPFSYLNHLFTQSGQWGDKFNHSLENIITAGEQLKITSGLKEFLQNNPQVKLHNHYGSSEMHVVTSYTLDGEDAGNVPVPPAGRPVANTHIFILDQNYQPVPIGVWGELCIAGSSEIAGYINNKRLTSQKLLAHPSLAQPGNRLYCSGDIGRWLPDGNIELRGRKDTQIKIRGFRVELSEIESKILALSQVKDCVVMVRESQQIVGSGEATGSGTLSLVAYIVLDDIDIAKVKQHISAYLPQYMLPRFIVLPELPLMPNGKVDREKLPQLMIESEEQELLTRPVSLVSGGKLNLNQLLAAIWETIAPHTSLPQKMPPPKIEVAEHLEEISIQTASEMELSQNLLLNKTLPQLVSEQALQNPDALALVDFSLIGEDTPTPRSMTYGELDRLANRLAQYLIQRNIGNHSLVVLLLESSLQLVVAVLAVLKTGAAYLPITPGTDEQQIKTLLEDSGAACILSHTHISREYTFLELRNIQPGRSTMQKTAVRPQILNFDALPIPDRSYVNYEKYGKHIGLAMVKHTLTLQATRGCPYNCAYCHKIWPKKHVKRSAENIYKELETYYNMGMRRFVFVDDIFNLDVDNSRKFFQLVIDNGLDVQLMFPAGLRGDTLTEDYIDLMVKAGTINVALALETASPRLQKLVGKNLNLNRFRQIVQYFCEKHPQVVLELFTMHGFPTETEEEALMTLDFVMDMKWIHFPYINILRIYANTDMEALALRNGVTPEAIERSATLAYHELPDTLPFDKGFTFQYQTRYLNEYFLNKERLLHVLPMQMKVFTEDEIVQKYNSFLPTRIESFSQLLQFCGIQPEELSESQCMPEERMKPDDIHNQMCRHFSPEPADSGALRVLLLDLSQRFVREATMLYDGVETPLGLMYLMTYLKQQLGPQVDGRIAKSRTDFADYPQLHALLKDFKPHVIGIRTLTYFSDFFHEAVSMIRQWGIEATIIAGGPYGTSDYSIILEDPSVDLIVLGEGELTFTQLMQSFIQHENQMPSQTALEQIPGIVYVKERINNTTNPLRDVLLLDHMEQLIPEESETIAPPPLHPSQLAAVTVQMNNASPQFQLERFSHHNAIMQLVQWQENTLSSQEKELHSAFLIEPQFQQLFGAFTQGKPLYLLPPHIRPNRIPQLEILLPQSESIDNAHLHVLLEPLQNKDSANQAQPGDEVERGLLELFAAVLELDKTQLGLDSNFFDFGGHSLKATQLISKIHKTFQVNLRLMEIFKTPTVAEIAQLIRNEKMDQFVEIPQAGEKEYYPLSAQQQRLYIVQQIDEQNTLFNMPATFKMNGPVSIETFQHIFQQLIQRHESLRTSFHTVDDIPMQKIHQSESIHFRIETDFDLPSFIKPFDLSLAPLFRVGIQRIADQEFKLIVDMHHIISDGTSIAIIVQEFMALYNGETLPPVNRQYKDYAQWQQNQLQSQDNTNPLKLQEDYWLNLFSQSVPRLQLITDFPRPQVQSFKGKALEFRADASLTTQLKQLASRTGTTLYVVLLAVYTILLSRYSNNEEIVVGTGIAGRRHSDLQDIIGMFVNMIAMKNHVSHVKTFEEFLNEVKNNAFSAFQNQDYPFDRLVERLGLQGESSRNPLFDVEFTLQNVDIKEVQLPGLTIIPEPPDSGSSKFDLGLHATETGDSITFLLDYAVDLFKDQTIEEMGNRFLEILNTIVRDSYIKIENITLSSQISTADQKLSREKVQFEF